MVAAEPPLGELLSLGLDGDGAFACAGESAVNSICKIIAKQHIHGQSQLIE
ncbi:hypothetical protein NG895_11110 [Aeoliella sp. ICT_H6.2]|uniref:Uncharacterized protein n=1 Tax=Aeoliella straminimaris TaxID=2954799 RepID=A0A9X2FA61_9BACT|nr:hypothetical protein [Aeoliella straminimaris]MCO6044453.1 hypothetical protein [Aeoliella straminimaris]